MMFYAWDLLNEIVKQIVNFLAFVWCKELYRCLNTIIIIKLLISLFLSGLLLRTQSWVFLSATMSMAPGYLHKNLPENRPKELSSCSIPLILIG